MKILHTADWHIGQRFYGYDRQEEHRYFLEWLKNTVTEQKIDVMMIAGDIFDSPNPSAESQQIYYRFLSSITSLNPQLQIVIIAGNHDSAARLEAPQSVLENLNIFIRGTIKRTSNNDMDLQHLIIPLQKDNITKAWCLAVPFLRQGDLPQEQTLSSVYSLLSNIIEEKNTSRLPIIAMGHLHVNGSSLCNDDKSERVVIGGLESVESHIFSSNLNYVALGHLHKPQCVAKQTHIRYVGSPIPMSFSEKNYQHGVNVIHIENNAISNIARINFEPLTRLISIPHHPAPLTKVLEQINTLPAGTISNSSPYLEVKVLENEPEPSKRFQIEKALQGKAIKLATIKAISNNTASATNPNPIEHMEAWQQIEPLEIAQQVFKLKYGSTMPPQLSNLLSQTIQEAYLTETK